MAQRPTFSGLVQINVGETMHRRLYKVARDNDQSMTAFVKQVLKEKFAQIAADKRKES